VQDLPIGVAKQLVDSTGLEAKANEKGSIVCTLFVVQNKKL
jgi:hypothetical protein